MFRLNWTKKWQARKLVAWIDIFWPKDTRNAIYHGWIKDDRAAFLLLYVLFYHILISYSAKFFNRRLGDIGWYGPPGGGGLHPRLSSHLWFGCGGFVRARLGGWTAGCSRPLPVVDVCGGSLRLLSVRYLALGERGGLLYASVVGGSWECSVVCLPCWVWMGLLRLGCGCGEGCGWGSPLLGGLLYLRCSYWHLDILGSLILYRRRHITEGYS